MKIVITDWNFPNIDAERKIIEGAGHTLVDAQCTTEEEVAEVVADADVVLAQWAPVKARAVAAMRNCRGIVRYGIGLDNIDLDAARRKGIKVANIPDYCLNEVADHTMALMLACQRQILPTWQRINRGEWLITSPKTLPPLRESTLGLIGLGRIARRVALRARAFGMRVIAFDPAVNGDIFKKVHAEAVTPEEIWRQSDIISLHCPLNRNTYHLINAEVLKKMKRNVLLINTSRGGLIDTSALTEALRSDQIAGAGLDVVEEEPLSRDHPLLKAPNVTLTSHIAWHSGKSMAELQQLAAEKALELAAL